MQTQFILASLIIFCLYPCVRTQPKVKSTCSKPGQWYDEFRQTCFLLTDEPCTLNPSALQCAPNSSCSKVSGRLQCKCDGNVVPSRDGRCLRSYGESCDHLPDSCDTTANLHCNKSKICTCKAGTRLNASRSGCQSPVIAACSGSHECTPPALCLSNGVCALSEGSPCTPGEVPSCAPKSSCLRRAGVYKCVCDEGLFPNSAGECFVPYNASCHPASSPGLCDTSSFMQCGLTQRCECTDQPNSQYNPTSESCHLLAAAKCGNGVGDQECVQNSACDPITGRCACVAGYVPSKTRSCGLQFEATCTPSDEPSEDQCLMELGLECDQVSESCLCSYKAIFDHGIGRCVGLEGSPCSSNEMPCAPDSACVRHDGTSYCQCLAGFTPNKNRLCFLSHGAPCQLERPNQCDPASFLTCDHSLHCACNENITNLTSWFDSNSESCKLLVGSGCRHAGTNDPTIQECVPNAFCTDDEHEEGQTKCECVAIPGMGALSVTAERQCALEHNAPCSASYDLCDRSKKLECTERGVCACVDEALNWYDVNTKTCFLTHGQSCGDNSAPCLPNSYCDQFTKSCKCFQGFESNDAGHCFLSHGVNCSQENDLCNPLGFLECGVDSKCSCANPHQTLYDENIRSCRLVADAPCELPSLNPAHSPIQKCVENSACQLVAGDSVFQCKCESGLESNRFGNCYLGHNQKCKQDEPSGKYDLCDVDNFLRCGSSQICECGSRDTIYNPGSGSCERIAGGECFRAHVEPSCVPNSECNSEKECACKTGYEPSSQRTCLPSYGTSCESSQKDHFNSSCNHDSNLDCIDQKCSCRPGFYASSNADKVRCYPGYLQLCGPENDEECSKEANLICSQGICTCPLAEDQTFDVLNGTCASLAGKPCRTTDSTGISYPCLGNAYCSHQRSRLNDQTFGTCACKEGFSEDENGFCSNGFKTVSCFSLILVSTLYCLLAFFFKYFKILINFLML